MDTQREVARHWLSKTFMQYADEEGILAVHQGVPTGLQINQTEERSSLSPREPLEVSGHNGLDTRDATLHLLHHFQCNMKQ